MPEETPARDGAKLKARVEELEKAVKALLLAMKEIEENEGEEYMGAGNFLGVEF